MFTGIVQALGRIADWERSGNDARISVTSSALDVSQIARGDSLAVNGVCLTVVELRDETVVMDVSAETLARTTFGRFKRGDEVNLETPLTPQSRLGGHLVTGHVDGVGEVTRRTEVGESVRLTVAAPLGLARYIAEKGSVCVDGVSLTVNNVSGAEFGVNLIPHTLQVTTLGRCVSGTRVNLEVDIIARYLERLLTAEREAPASTSGITHEFLARHGFADG